MTEENKKRQLQWQCRRGMLELDIMLQRFMDSGYDQLSPEDKKQFSDLLRCQDDQLFRWFMGHEVCDNPVLQKLIGLISH